MSAQLNSYRHMSHYNNYANSSFAKGFTPGADRVHVTVTEDRPRVTLAEKEKAKEILDEVMNMPEVKRVIKQRLNKTTVAEPAPVAVGTMVNNDNKDYIYQRLKVVIPYNGSVEWTEGGELSLGVKQGLMFLKEARYHNIMTAVSMDAFNFYVDVVGYGVLSEVDFFLEKLAAYKDVMPEAGVEAQGPYFTLNKLEIRKWYQEVRELKKFYDGVGFYLKEFLLYNNSGRAMGCVKWDKFEITERMSFYETVGKLNTFLNFVDMTTLDEEDKKPAAKKAKTSH